MIKMKIYVDIPLFDGDFYPGEYLPSDVIVYNFDPTWFDIDEFCRLLSKEVKEKYTHYFVDISHADIKEVEHERKKTCKGKKRQKNI